MSSIWSVYAVFEDKENTSWMLIGNFTNKSEAEQSKNKWLSFFEQNLSILDEPKDWIPENDKWYSDWDSSQSRYQISFSWFDSEEYHSKLSDYKYLKDFSDIFIEEQPLNEDIFIENMPYDSIIKIAKEFNRDYKINELIK